jgi:multiple antibiotic resistance protein
MRPVALRDAGSPRTRSEVRERAGARAVGGRGIRHLRLRQGEIVDIAQRLSLGMFFTAFFVILGPVKLIAPFAALTADLEVEAARRLARKGLGLACVGGTVAAVLGQRALATWGVSRATLLLAAGIVLFVVALSDAVATATPSGATAPVALPSHPARSPLTVPLIPTPYGAALAMK